MKFAKKNYAKFQEWIISKIKSIPTDGFGSNIKIYTSKNIFSNMFNKKNKFIEIILILFGFIFLYFGYYIFSTYMFVGLSFLLLGLDKFEFTKEELKIEHHKIDTETLPNSFEIKSYHILFMVITLSIAFFFNILIGVFYIFFILFGFIGGIFKFNIYKIIPQKVYNYSKNCKKDLKTITYHWSNQFFFFKILNRLTIISLPLGIIILAFALPFHAKNDPILILNLYHAGIIFFTNVILFFFIDLYIIFFSNTSVLNKFGLFCYRCGAYSLGILGVGSVTEKQVIFNSFDRLGLQWHPTFFTNIPRVATGKPLVLDADQYWHAHIIQKYLPDITYDQYSTKYNNIVSQIDSTKTNKILRDNWDTLSQNCTKQELYRTQLKNTSLSNIIGRQ